MEERLRESQTSLFMQREAAERDKMGLEEEATQLRSALLASQAESNSLKVCIRTARMEAIALKVQIFQCSRFAFQFSDQESASDFN